MVFWLNSVFCLFALKLNSFNISLPESSIAERPIELRHLRRYVCLHLSHSFPCSSFFNSHTCLVVLQRDSCLYGFVLTLPSAAWKCSCHKHPQKSSPLPLASPYSDSALNVAIWPSMEHGCCPLHCSTFLVLISLITI